jgi:thiol-disulfide isomerase/thioredoxin/chitodextrinase
MKRAVCLTLTLLVAASAATAQEMKDAREILKKADAATKKVQTVQYEATYEGIGGMKDKAMRVSGTAILSSTDPEKGDSKMHFEAKAQKPGQDEAMTVQAGTDGTTWYGIRPDQKKVTKGDGGWAFGDASVATSLTMREYIHPEPFSDEINADKADLQGIENVAGEKCYKIYVQYAQSMGESIWYFSTTDFLPRRVDRIGKDDAGEIMGTALTLKNVQVDPKFTRDPFALVVPEGFEVETVSQPERPKLLAVGTQAPDWTLQTPGGESVSLNQLKGSVVVMDFWATWCGPCKAAMPHVQKLHEEFKGKGVKIFGVNTWERDGDPVKYMKDNNYTYGLLLEGDDVATAYKVSGIPTFYVIDRDGKIAYIGVGAGSPDALETAIKKALENKEG